MCSADKSCRAYVDNNIPSLRVVDQNMGEVALTGDKACFEVEAVS